MSPQELENEQEAAAVEDASRENDSVANKLSKELSNWRRQRNGGRTRHPKEGQGSGFKSDSARTIKVRGHETLVIRKSKVANKAPATTDESDR
jgi:hypothetical protein